MNAIEINDLSKHYGSVKALDGLNLSVASGSVFGFLGPNGAGKTTTLRILTGLARANGGRASIAGKPLDSRGGTARLVGYLPEEPTFYTWMTPLELLDHVGRIFGQPVNERLKQARQLLELVGLYESSKRRIAGFSRGMRQRLGLAQALMNDPQVLLLDEPVSALDPEGRKEVLEMIAALKGSATVFMSTHILTDVERICDMVGIIDRGKLVTEGRRSELMARYQVNALLVEVETGHEADLSKWVNKLKTKWLTGARLEGATARIAVNDIEIARRELLSLLSQTGLPVLRFEVATPTLEDVFLQLVSGNMRAK
ncbi:MAG: ABC transporter ATP-binding protein [Anaerolineaceae bacterium]